MKKQALKVFTFTILLVVLATATAYSQGKTITVNIPFQFSVHDKTLPAGVYTIGQSFPSNWNGLTIRSQDGRISVAFMTTTVQSAENPFAIKLVFTKYGDQYFLSQFYRSRERTGRELSKSHAERELARSLAEHGTRPETVLITFR